MHHTACARRRARLRAPALLLLALPALAAAGLTVPPGATLQLGDGRLELAGGDLTTAGTLQLGSGSVDAARSVRVLPGGQLALGTGVLRLSADWNNAGTVTATTSTVQFLDGAADSQLLGSTSFGDLLLSSSQGKRLRLQAGATQTVAGLLQLRGDGMPLRIESTLPGDTAFLALAEAGIQDIANVAVADVHGTGQWLAPGLTNQGGNDNTAGWFGDGSGGAPAPPPLSQPVVIPATSAWSLLVFAIAVLLTMRRLLRTTPASRGN